MRAIPVLLALAVASPAIAQQPAHLWKARGLQAEERVAEIAAKLEKASAPDRKKMLWEALIEGAFANQISQPKLAHQRTAMGEAFHLFIRANQKTSLPFLDIVYLYGADGTLTGVRIDRLPPDWHVMFTPSGTTAGVFVIKPGDADVMLMFSTTEPFEPVVMLTD